MKEFVKKMLKSCALGRVVYEPLHRLYRLYSVPHRRRMLQSRGRVVLQRIIDAFDRHHVPGFVAAGSLLGFVRDGGFMPHDDDIDVGVLPGEWSPVRLLRMLVEEEGFKFEFAFKFRERTVEFKVSWDGVPIDVFCYERNDDDFYCTCFYYFPEIHYPSENANSVWRIHEYNIQTIKKIHVMDMDVPVPSDPERVMEKLYGDDWRTPNPNWDDSMHPGREVMEGEFGYSVDYAEAIKE